jgi:hypothetical protein
VDNIQQMPMIDKHVESRMSAAHCPSLADLSNRKTQIVFSYNFIYI